MGCALSCSEEVMEQCLLCWPATWASGVGLFSLPLIFKQMEKWWQKIVCCIWKRGFSLRVWNPVGERWCTYEVTLLSAVPLNTFCKLLKMLLLSLWLKSKQQQQKTTQLHWPGFFQGTKPWGGGMLTLSPPPPSFRASILPLNSVLTLPAVGP